jgi:hypothetical protein
LAIEFTLPGAVTMVKEGEGLGVGEGDREVVTVAVGEALGLCVGDCGESVGDTVCVSVVEVVLVELPPSVKDDVGVAVRLGVTVRLEDVVGVALAAASLYSVPPSSATRISLLFDSEGEPRTGRARGTDQSIPPELLRDLRLPVALPTLVPTTKALKQLKCAGVDSVNVSEVELMAKDHRRTPVLLLNVWRYLPTGRATIAVPTRVVALAGSHSPMPSTVGEARGAEPSLELQSISPLSSKDCSTPSDVPLGDATTNWLMPDGLSPALVPGMASTAVVVGDGRGTDQRRLPEARRREIRELSVAAYAQAPEAPRSDAPARMGAPAM